MNKSRKMLADVASALAQRGVATVLPDFYGTGDSEGEFRDADIDVWVQDLVATSQWVASIGWPIRSLLCVRLGCTIGARLVRHADMKLHSSVFWQPVLDGRRFLTQFLRLRVAASMMSDAGKECVEQLRARLHETDSLEVAGYELTRKFADQVEQLQLGPELVPAIGMLHWMELVRGDDAQLTPAGQASVEAARAKHVQVTAHAIAGEPFWSSVEILRNPDLVARTVEALSVAA